MSGEFFAVGDPVKDSPVGPGAMTGISDRGYPQVNHVTVMWLVRDDGAVFGEEAMDKTLIHRVTNKLKS